jgi:hypothetical protein
VNSPVGRSVRPTGEIMTEFLGPLELVGDRWNIGDSEREGGS